ncbi:MAG: MFS transporter [Clostridia bacterium]|nr:MFS transporter [Clostridia bacterium]
MNNTADKAYMKGFLPYALAALLVGLVGGFSTVLGPAFVRDLGLPYNNATWTALATAMSTAACAPILGKLGDAIGRRRTLILGILVYTLGNLLTAIAPSLLFMLIARFVVGIGSAAIAPVVMAYIVTEFPPARIAKGFSLYMILSSGSVVFGPTLGGLLINGYGWRVMMWVCVGICAAIFAACLFFREHNVPSPKGLTGFDSLGGALVLVFFSLVLCVPSFGQNFGWSSAPFIGVLIGAIVSLFGLIYAEKRAENPILQGSFMARKAFLLSVAALFLTQGLMQANMTNIIVFLMYTQPENTIISSYSISIMYIGMALGALLLGPLADKREPKQVLTFSLLFTGIGCGLMLLFTENASVLILALSLGILGFGLGANGTIFMKVALSGIPAEKAGAGTGTYGLFRDLAAPFGVAVFVPMFTNRITAEIAAGASDAAAAVASIRTLAFAELICIAAGIAVVQLLPRIHQKV